MEKTLVKMVNTKRGCDDGITVRTYEAGETYSMSPDLAKEFIHTGDGKIAKVNGRQAPEHMAHGEAPETK